VCGAKDRRAVATESMSPYHTNTAREDRVAGRSLA